MSDWWKEYQVDLPDGTCGNWHIEHREVTADEAKHDALMGAISGNRRHVREGRYAMLYRGGTLVMSDTPDEISDHLYAIRKAQGHVLIAGLGLGMVAEACLKKPEVSRVTVVELAREVITLVGTHLLARYGAKLEIVNASIFEYKPDAGVRYGMAWFDIWDDICTDNLTEMAKLHRKYTRRCEWYGSWCHELLKHRKRQEDRQFAGWR